MASKAIFLLAIIASITYANAMAIEKFPEDFSIGDHREIPAELALPEVSGTRKALAGTLDEDQVNFEKSSLVEKRSIEEDDVKIISNNDIVEDNEDDLETAAGTNVLRPLFVYRQQLAYRERVRKAGRRAAPNF